MKHQYFGDIGDYKKFSLLRHLSEEFNIMVCWMLTEDDTSNDGRFIHFLRDPQNWRHYDNEIFDVMRNSVVVKGYRNLSIIEDSSIISKTRFFSETLNDNEDNRRIYMEELKKNCIGVDMIFFDPDNGIEVGSVNSGAKNSKKYIYWSELKKSHKEGFNLLIYQHFPRQNRDNYIRGLSLKVIENLNMKTIFSIKTRHAVFLLSVNETKYEATKRLLHSFKNKWKEHIDVTIQTTEEVILIESNDTTSLNNQMTLF